MPLRALVGCGAELRGLATERPVVTLMNSTEGAWVQKLDYK